MTGDDMGWVDKFTRDMNMVMAEVREAVEAANQAAAKARAAGEKARSMGPGVYVNGKRLQPGIYVNGEKVADGDADLYCVNGNVFIVEQ